jgi:hypothetical protein
MADVTDIRDAQAARALGMPLNTPVVDCEFSPAGEKLMNDTIKAALALRRRALAHQERNTPKSQAAFRRAFDKLAELHARVVANINADNSESMAVAAVIGPRIDPIIATWRVVFDKLDCNVLPTQAEVGAALDATFRPYQSAA